MLCTQKGGHALLYCFFLSLSLKPLFILMKGLEQPSDKHDQEINPT